MPWSVLDTGIQAGVDGNWRHGGEAPQGPRAELWQQRWEPSRQWMLGQRAVCAEGPKQLHSWSENGRPQALVWK